MPASVGVYLSINKCPLCNNLGGDESLGTYQVWVTYFFPQLHRLDGQSPGPSTLLDSYRVKVDLLILSLFLRLERQQITKSSVNADPYPAASTGANSIQDGRVMARLRKVRFKTEYSGQRA